MPPKTDHNNSVELPYRSGRIDLGLFDYDGVTTMREVFCGVISQGVAPFYFQKNY